MLINKIVIWICNNIDLLDCKLNSDCIHSLILLGLLLRLDHPEALALPAERENIIGAFFLTAVKSQFASTKSIVFHYGISRTFGGNYYNQYFTS